MQNPVPVPAISVRDWNTRPYSSRPTQRNRLATRFREGSIPFRGRVLRSGCPHPVPPSDEVLWNWTKVRAKWFSGTLMARLAMGQLGNEAMGQLGNGQTSQSRSIESG